MESFIESVTRKMSVSDDSGVSSGGTSPGESESRSGSFSYSQLNMRGKDTPLPSSINNNLSNSNAASTKTIPTTMKPRQSAFQRPLIRITVEPVSSDDSGGEEDDQDSSIFLELSESGTGYSDKTLIEIDGLIEDEGIMVSCEPVDDDGHHHHHHDDLLVSEYLDHSGNRVHSSPSHTNLSDGSEENSGSGERDQNNKEVDNIAGDNGGGGLKVVDKPIARRRNTIADIFRWLIESDSKSFNSLQGANSNHSRKSSDTSELSLEQGSDKGSSEDTEEDLWITWGRIVNEWDTFWKKKNPFVRELVRRGIPHHFRGIVWQLLCGAHDSSDKAKYADYIKATSACEKVIRRDIARTYPEHEFFKEKDGLGQESLFNVMKAYSLHDREVGYCQGSAFIVGLLLMQMPEEEAFAVVVKLMQDYRLREMFKPSMAELGLCMYQLEMNVQEQLPDLHVHFQSQGVHTSMYASSWFLTIFTTSLPLAISSRIMDQFLMDGIEVVFRIGLALLTIAKNELLFLDMEGVLRNLSKELPLRIEADPELLFNATSQIKYNAKRMKKLEKDYAAMKTKEQEEMVELRRLRTENKLLKQRIEILETESSELANKLIQGQVGRAEEVETTFTLKRELASVRQQYMETMKQLENVAQQYQHLLLVLDETNSTKQTSMDEISLKSELLKQKEDLIHCLQNELVEVRLQEAENSVILSDLRCRIQEQEEDKKKLRESVVDNSVAHLQEELIAVKLREAEASLSLKDLRGKVADLTSQWQRHLQDHDESSTEKKSNATPLGNLFNSSKVEVQRLEEEVMTLKLREMQSIIELKEQRLKIMELETQVQVTSNQLKRQEDDSKRIREDLDSSWAQDKDMQSKLKDERRRYSDLESKLKEESVHARIKDAEKSQRIFDLSQIISALKLKNQELLAEKELMRDRTRVSSRTSESKSDGDKSDSESDTHEQRQHHHRRGDKDRLKELQSCISTLNTQMNNFNDPPSTPLEDLTFKPPLTKTESVDGLKLNLTNGHSQLASSLSNGAE
ncbi:ecotropic viral integration site 5 ortholog isoform X1 [Folsomia candida]|nr:ecotropic viral integration site 5 ortholog isoform X1 [Folsomia candida]